MFLGFAIGRKDGHRTVGGLVYVGLDHHFLEWVLGDNSARDQ